MKLFAATTLCLLVLTAALWAMNPLPLRVLPAQQVGDEPTVDLVNPSPEPVIFSASEALEVEPAVLAAQVSLATPTPEPQPAPAGWTPMELRQPTPGGPAPLAAPPPTLVPREALTATPGGPLPLAVPPPTLIPREALTLTPTPAR